MLQDTHAGRSSINYKKESCSSCIWRKPHLQAKKSSWSPRCRSSRFTQPQYSGAEVFFMQLGNHLRIKFRPGSAILQNNSFAGRSNRLRRGRGRTRSWDLVRVHPLRIQRRRRTRNRGNLQPKKCVYMSPLSQLIGFTCCKLRRKL